MFDIHYCPEYPVEDIQASTMVYRDDHEKFRPALAENISKQGLVNPLIILNHRDPARYKERWLKTGNNRYWAIKNLGWTHVPCLVTGHCDHPSTKVTFDEAQELIKDGTLIYIVEAHGGILQLEGVCKPESYEYPVVS